MLQYNTIEDTKTEKRSEFNAILNDLRLEINRAIELASFIEAVGNSLKPFPVNNEKTAQIIEVPGLVNALWTEISRLREVNDKNEGTANHFKGIICL